MPDISYGIGTDIVEVARIEAVLERKGSQFLSRLFTQKEIVYCQSHKRSIIHFSGRFAGKEAVSKALGVGIGKELGWLEIEILNTEKGIPIVYLSQQAKERLLLNSELLLSISHDENYATATAIKVPRSTPMLSTL